MFFYLFPSPNKNNTGYRNETKKMFYNKKKVYFKSKYVILEFH